MALMYHYILLLILLLSTSFNCSAQDINCKNSSCVAVINAGSSGTRSTIFVYDQDQTLTPINIKTLWNNSVSPALDKLTQQQDIFAYLDRLLGGEPVNTIRVYFYSTAGMRLLANKDNINIHKIIRSWFKQHPKWALMEARTITGEEEGILAFLTVNYQLKRLQNNGLLASVLDIGGSSTQIIAPVAKKNAHTKGHLHELSVYGKKIGVISYSLLGFGQNIFPNQFSNVTYCYSEGYPLSTGSKGHGNISKCIKIMTEQMIKKFSFKEIQQTAIQGPQQDWYLIGGITNLFHTPFFSSPSYFSNNTLVAVADKRICRQQWSTLEKSTNDSNLSRYCLLSAYIYTLLINGYGISSSSEVHLMPSDLNSDWSLGVLFFMQQKTKP